MKYVNLRGPAYVNGALRYPHEGTLHLTNEEADRLLKEKLADDVSEDFAGIDDPSPPQHVSADEPTPPASKSKPKA